MKYIFSLLFFISTIVAKGQVSGSLIHYYKAVNKAEMLIVDSNYIEAYNNYKTAFKFKKNPFGKDKYNQAICAVLINKPKTAYKNFTYLLDYGYQLDSLKHQEVLREFFKSKYGKKTEVYNNKKKLLYNVKLRAKYDSLLVADQFFRIKKGSYAVYGDTIEKIDNKNVDIIKELINEYGFPSQKLIGLYPWFDYEAIKIIVIHNQKGNRFGQYYDFTNTLYDGLYKGELDVRVALQLISGSTGKDTFGFTFAGIERHGLDTIDNPKNVILSNWGRIKLNQSKEKEFNESREKIGACTIAEECEKAVFVIADNRFIIGSSGNRKNYIWANEKDYKSAISNIIFLE